VESALSPVYDKVEAPDSAAGHGSETDLYLLLIVIPTGAVLEEEWNVGQPIENGRASRAARGTSVRSLTMSSQDRKIDTRCPACDTRYRVPSSSLGHRARCVKCRAAVRVSQDHRADHNSSRHHSPTEEDILKWLNEGADEEFIAPRPRIVGGGKTATGHRAKAEPKDAGEEEEDSEPGSESADTVSSPMLEDSETVATKSS
jgi:predicted Zn finger-like uncharacterized protein